MKKQKINLDQFKNLNLNEIKTKFFNISKERER